VLISDTLPILLTDLTVTSTLPLTPTGHAWAVGSLPPGAGGIITLTGHVSPALTSELTFTNTATISTPITDTQPANNTSFVVSEVNLPPVVDAGPDASARVGQPFVLSASFTDPGLDDMHTAEIAWGDGLTETIPGVTSLFTVTHVYMTTGVFTVTLWVTDSDGGQGTDSFSFLVFEPTSYVLYLPLLKNFFNESLSVVDVSPTRNNPLVSQQTMLKATYNLREIISDTVHSETFVVQSSLTGRLAGTYYYSWGDDTVSFVPDRPFEPGEIIQATLTTGIGSKTYGCDEVTLPCIIHPDFPTVWHFQVASAGGSGFMQPASPPSFGSGDSSDLGLGDLDLDGDWDAVVTKWNSPAEVWLNDGNQFTPHPVGPEFGTGPNVAVVLGDVDRDGDLDAVLAGPGAESVWLNDGVGNFSSHPASPTFGAGISRDVVLGDVDGDGFLDAVVANTNGEPETVWLNDGTGGFVPHPETPSFGHGASTSVALGDVDSDFDLDLVVANENGEPETMWVNDGEGNFALHPTTPVFGGGASQALALADLDLDGDLDAAVANTGDEAETVWLNDGNGMFSAHPTLPTFGAGNSIALAIGDLDGDHDLDVVVANAGNEPETVWLNDGQGGFAEAGVPPAFGAGSSTALALGDLDGDDDLDVVVANESGETVWTNEEMHVVSTSPAGNGSIVALNGSLTAHFDRPINPGTVHAGTFLVHGFLTGVYAGSFAFPANDTVVFTPNEPFKPGETLFVSLTAGIRSAAQNLPLSSYVWELRGEVLGGSGSFSPNPQAATIDFGNMSDFDLGDFDQDGDLDVVTQKNINAVEYTTLWVNDGLGNYSVNPAQDPLACEASCSFPNNNLGDMDNDGDLDILQTSYFDKRIWINDGNGVFSLIMLENLDAYSLLFAYSLQFGDLDGDGDLDIVAEDYGSLKIWFNDGTGNFPWPPVVIAVEAILPPRALHDFDQDGDLDILWLTQGPEIANIPVMMILKNNGSGDFRVEDVGFFSGAIAFLSSVAVGDLDLDADLDILLSQNLSSPPDQVWLNDGTGHFTLHPVIPGFREGEAHWVDYFHLLDLEGDGDLDSAVYMCAQPAYFTALWVNDGTGIFTSQPSLLDCLNDPSKFTLAYQSGDLDGDGDLDILWHYQIYQSFEFIYKVDIYLNE
ncbi:MAG: VCBS repeat-containing protein, partial [Anaerolineales bacterium]|nr:VCBS repeat-containing protein [Anaerolineales bacterium]